MRTGNRIVGWLFWIGIVLVFLLNIQQLLAVPVHFGGAVRSPVIINEVSLIEYSPLDSQMQLRDREEEEHTNNEDDEDEEHDHRGASRTKIPWIELYNRSPRTVDLAGWTLTDEPTQPDKWMFPSRTLESGEYLLIFTSGRDDSNDSPERVNSLRTELRLDSKSGFLALYPPTSRRYLDTQPLNIAEDTGAASYGYLATSSTYGYLTVATPGGINDESQSWQQLEEPVEYSFGSGYYDAPFFVALHSDVPGAIIRYTDDGSEPSESNGTIYRGPIRVTNSTVLRAKAWNGGASSSSIATRTYLFTEDILNQPALPAGFPETWGSYRIDRGGHTAGAPVVGDYAMDQRVIGYEEDRRRVIEGLHALPALSLVMDTQHFTDIYSDPQRHGPDAERPVSAELFYPDGRPEGFQIDSGIRVQGGASRWEHIPKHSFRLFFRSRYGEGKLRYPLFPDSPVTEFDTLVLRAGMQDAYVGHSTTMDRDRMITYIRDEWMRATQVKMSGYGSHGTFVHLYINGLYWGLYNVVERPDQNFASSYFGGHEDEWYAANHGGSIKGQTDRFDVLIRLAQEAGLEDSGKYATMLEFIDPVRFSDYLILNWYIGNGDWPRNNWYVTVRYPAGRNHFYIWDGEKGLWGDGPRIVLEQTNLETAWPNVIKTTFQALMQNPEYRMLFADRLYATLFGDGALATQNAQKRWLALAEIVEKAIVPESARWGDVWFDPPITLADWYTARDAVTQEMATNSVRLLQLARAQGYYPAIDPPRFGHSGGTVETPFVLTIEASHGVIYFTTDDSDPRQEGGRPSPSAQQYAGPLAIPSEIQLPAIIKARLLLGDTWSALAQAQYTRPDQVSDVRITEIMYNPIGGDLYEYVELTNLGDLPADLSLASFQGIDLIFPLDTVLRPGESQTVIKDYWEFRERYPEAPFMGFYEGRLSNGGETIALHDRTGKLITSVRYDDEDTWPWSADGRGDSLVLVRPSGDPNDASSWRASANLHGSPGEFELESTRNSLPQALLESLP